MSRPSPPRVESRRSKPQNTIVVSPLLQVESIASDLSNHRVAIVPKTTRIQILIADGIGKSSVDALMRLLKRCIRGILYSSKGPFRDEPKRESVPHNGGPKLHQSDDDKRVHDWILD